MSSTDAMKESLKPTRPTTASRGAFLSVAMRWTDRLLGLLSTVILARLLVPGDFGLVAMAMVAVGFFDVLLDLGVGSALIQHERLQKFKLRRRQAQLLGPGRDVIRFRVQFEIANS
jgi:hypothetical protein